MEIAGHICRHNGIKKTAYIAHSNCELQDSASMFTDGYQRNCNYSGSISVSDMTYTATIKVRFLTVIIKQGMCSLVCK
jgi:hypothetical protein